MCVCVCVWVWVWVCVGVWVCVLADCHRAPRRRCAQLAAPVLRRIRSHGPAAVATGPWYGHRCRSATAATRTVPCTGLAVSVFLQRHRVCHHGDRRRCPRDVPVGVRSRGPRHQLRRLHAQHAERRDVAVRAVAAAVGAAHAAVHRHRVRAQVPQHRRYKCHQRGQRQRTWRRRHCKHGASQQ